MIKKITFLLTLFFFSTITAQTNFGWDTAVPTITETINGITTTVVMVDSNDPGVIDFDGAEIDFGTSGNILVNSINGDLTTTVIFNFSEAVNINSILALEGIGSDIDYTFTPTGGTNAIVVASLVGGFAAVNLNWNDVTSFTVSSSGALYGFEDLLINDVTNFGWETTNSLLTETINGIMTSVIMVGSNDPGVVDAEGGFGSSGNIIISSLSATPTTTVIFNFSEAVNISSIVALWGSGSNEYTFTPSDGSNSVVEIALGGDNLGGDLVNLNWTDVTSFTVTSSGTVFGFDNLLINDSALSTNKIEIERIKVSPNPSINYIEISGFTGVKNYTIYNAIGTEISKGIIFPNEKIEIKNYSHGLYFLKFKNGNTFKFIKH